MDAYMENVVLKLPAKKRRHRNTTVSVTIPNALLQTLRADAIREVRSLEEQILWYVLQGLKKEISNPVAQSEGESHANEI